ncbi:hypothetical protein Q9R46_14440 [Paenibacillus sp. RRE4]|uniref:hypothetical protein n=1 Tax=Paenibacillus sp. RRE4 TaxID=2962587 RepID=UPI002882606B|nr:hypothetical protein [Paenibacillus sp. RRE4]MDT0123856.1 hypothetical protein [Paenibacillus sp. RRE4]
MKTRFKNRDKVFEYLDNYSSVVKLQANERKTVNTLLKSYIFETNMLESEMELTKIFQLKDCNTKEIDEEMLQVFRENEVVGFIEKVNNRFAVMHSIDTAQKSDYYTNSLLKNTPLLDSLWISGKMFDLFREKIRSQHSPHRYIKMKFEFNNIFSKGYSDGEFLDFSEYVDEGIFDDQVVTSIDLVEELADLERKIEGVRSFFSAFCAVGLLRFPSRVGKGGHDFYRNGKVTNRSDSFFDHRSQIRETINDYKLITESLETKTWLNFDVYHDRETGVKFQGSPVVFKFPTPLKKQVFSNFVESTFQNGNEPFKILGKPIWINKNKVHIYGTDINLWQKVNLELSREEFIAILPRGTCGNTIHRLVTNIQRYLNPEVDVYIGDQTYESFMKASIEGSAKNE